MTPEEMKQWIDGASYGQLLRKWRFEPIGSPWFEKETGKHFKKAMTEKRSEITLQESIEISKEIGW